MRPPQTIPERVGRQGFVTAADVDEHALQLRHMHALRCCQQLDVDERVGLLADVVAPRPRLQAASEQAATLELRRRLH